FEHFAVVIGGPYEQRKVLPYRFVPQTWSPADPIGRRLRGSGSPPPEPLFLGPKGCLHFPKRSSLSAKILLAGAAGGSFSLVSIASTAPEMSIICSDCMAVTYCCCCILVRNCRLIT